MVALGEVCEVIAGQSPPGHTYNRDGKGLPFFQGKTDFGEHYPVPRMWCTEPNKIALPGDLLISVRAPVGPTNLCDTQACIGRGIASIRPSEKVDVRYLMHWMRSIEPQVAALGRGSTFEAISKSDLVKVLIPLPPLPAQRRIAAILDKAQALVANDKRTLAVYDQLAKSLFLEMFGDPVRNERGWEKQRLAELCQSIVVGFVGACEKHYTGPDGIPMVRTGNLREGHLDFHNLKYVTREFHLKQRKSQLRKGDILIARHGDNGKASLYDGRFQEANSLNIVVLRPDTSKMLPQFLITVMNDQSMRTYIASRTGGATQKVVNTKEIQKLEFIAPSLSVQEDFVRRFDKLNAHRSQAEQSLRQSEALFGSLLQSAFAGGFGG